MDALFPVNMVNSLFDKINENKEKIKNKIQDLFTKIRNVLNEREDELLLEIDKLFDNKYFREEVIKDSQKLPNKIKTLLEKGKNIEKNPNDLKLNYLINDCINIENNIKYINIINKKIKECNSNELNYYICKEDEVNKLFDLIKIKIGYKNKNINKEFTFKKCPKNIFENRKFSITGDSDNIFTKISDKDGWMGTFCEKQLDKSKEYKWKVKILKTLCKNIMVGVVPIDIDINNLSSSYGWYYYLAYSSLYSGKPHLYVGKETNLSKPKNEIIIIMNMNKGTLKFIINNEDKGDSYTNIPLDKPIAPAVLLYNKNDSVEIVEC